VPLTTFSLSHSIGAVADIAVWLKPFLGPFYSAKSQGQRLSAVFPLPLISNLILQAADNHKGFKLALEVDDWCLWANRGSFYEIVRKTFTTGSTSNYHARRDISFFYRFFDSEKVAKKNETIRMHLPASVSSVIGGHFASENAHIKHTYAQHSVGYTSKDEMYLVGTKSET
jgi:hypothetical protein